MVHPLLTPLEAQDPSTSELDTGSTPSVTPGKVHPLISLEKKDPLPIDTVDLSGVKFEENPVEANYHDAIDVNPDEAAKTLELAKKLGQPPSTILEHMDAAKKAASIPPSEFFADIIDKYPQTAAFLSEPKNMGIAKDDIHSLKTTEQLVQDAGWWRTIGQSMASAAASLGAKAAGVPNVIQAIRYGGEDAPAVPGTQEAIQWWQDKARTWAPPIADQEWLNVIGTKDPAYIAKFATSRIAMMAPDMALLLGATAIGGPLAGGTYVGLGTASDYMARNRQMGLSGPDAASNAILHGTVNALIMGPGKYSPLHAWEEALVPKIGQTAAKQVVAQIFKNFGAAAIHMSGIMGATTGADAVIDYATGVDQAVFQGIGRKLANSMIEGLFMGFPMGFIPAGKSVIRGLQLANVHPSEVYTAVGDTIKASPVKTRSPEAMREFVDQTTKDSPIEKVGFRPDKWDTYWQEAGSDPMVVAKELGVGEQLADARNSGADLQIPFSTWTDKMVDTPHFEALKNDIVFAGQDLTANEHTAAWNHGVKEAIAAADEITKADPAAKEARQFAFDEVKRKLEGTGRYEGQKELLDKHAELAAAMLTREAARFDDPLAYVQDQLARTEITAGGVSAENTLHQSARDMQSDADWAKWNPDVTAGGLIKGGPDAAPTLRHLPKLRGLIRQLVQEGSPGRHWYRDVATEAMNVAQGDIVKADKFIQLLAIYSPHNNVPNNTQAAIKTFTHWLNGGSRETLHATTNAQDENARALLYDNKPWGGRKRSSFYANMLQELTKSAAPEDVSKLKLDAELQDLSQKPATVDLWILRAFGYLNAAASDDLGSGKYSFAENEIRRITAELNQNLKKGEEPWEPHQVQAAMWTGIKARHEIPSVKERTIEASVKRGFSSFDAQGKWMAPTNAEARSEHGRLWRKFALEAKPEDVKAAVQNAKTSFGDIVRRSTMNITWEAVPSASLNLEITKASPEVRAEFTAKAAELIFDPKTGADELAKKLGVRLGRTVRGTGGYGGTINENVIAGLIPPKPRGTYDTKPIEGYARAIQYIFKQDAVPWFRADSSADFNGDFRVVNADGRTVRKFDTQSEAEAFAKTKEGTTVKGGEFARGVLFKFGDSISPQIEEAFFQQLRKSLGNDAGYTKIGDREVAVINYRDEATGLPFTDDVAFLEALDKLGAEHGQRLGIESGEKIGTQGRYGPVHDWSADPEGKALLSDGSLKGSPDLQKWIHDRRAAFDALVEEFSGQNLRSRQENAKALDRVPEAALLQDTPLAPDDPRGFFTRTPEADFIGLLSRADPTTFPHELAHRWLENFKDFIGSGQRDEKYVADWNVIKDWLKLEDGKPISRDQHEKFAKGFETYLAEGKAPSEGLRAIFRKFQKWFAEVYGDIKTKLGIELPEPMRGVYDRMLASEEEIAFARRASGADLGLELKGLDPAVEKRLSTLRDRAHEQAVRTLMEKQMEELSSEQKRKRAEEVTKARVAAEDQVRNSPEQKALEAIGHSFQTKAPMDVVKEFWSEKMDPERRLQFRILAEMRGFDSAEEMAQKILLADTPERQVQALVDQHMEQFPDLRNSAQIKEAAIQAVHNDMQAEVLALERNVFESLVQEAQGRAVDQKRRAAEARVEAAAVKAQAKAIIAGKPVKEAGDFMPFFTAERNAALKANALAAKGDYAAAAEAKRQQMVAHALVSEAYKAKRSIERWTDYLDSVQKKDIALFKREEHFTQVAHILERFGVGRDDYDPSKKTETLQQWGDRMFEATQLVSLPPWMLDESISKPFNKLTTEELHDVVNAVKNIQRVANAEKNMLAIRRGEAMQNVVNELVAEQQRNIDFGKEYAPQVEPQRFERLRAMAAKYSSSLLKPSTLLMKLDGLKEFGPWMRTFWEPVYNAYNDESNRMLKVNEGLVKVWDAYTKKERNAMNEPVFNADLGVKISKMRMLVMALNLGTESNRARLFESRPVGIGPTTPWGEKAVVDLLQKNLDARDWKFVQSVWDLIGEQFPDAAKMHKELTGFTPGQIVPYSFSVTSSDGQRVELNGGYFPLRRDPRSSAQADLQAAADNPLYTEKNPAYIATTKYGYLKERVEGATYPVSLEIANITRHLRDVVHDIAFRPTIIDLRRLLNQEELQAAITQQLGPEGFRNLKTWVADVAGSDPAGRVGSTALEETVHDMRVRSTTAVLAYKLSLTVENLSNVLLYPGAAEGFGVKEATNGFFKRGMFDFMPKALFYWPAAKAIRDEVYALSPFMRDRARTPDFTFQESTRQMFGKDETIRDFGSHMIGWSDELVAIPMWREAYQMKVDAGAPAKEAVKYADKLIDNVVGSGRKGDVSAIQRGNEFERAAAMFYSFFNTMHQRAVVETGRFLNKPLDIKADARFLGFLAAHVVLFPIASNILSGRLPRRGQDEEAWWGKSLIQFQMQKLPFIREVSDVITDELFGLKSFGYRASPISAAIEAPIDFVREGKRYAQGKASGQDFAEAFGKAASFGVPFAPGTAYPDQYNKWFWNLYDYWNRGMTPQFRDLYTRRPRRERQ